MSGTGLKSRLTIDLAVACEDWSRDVTNITPLIEGAIAAAQETMNGPGGEISVLLTGDAAMQVLNKRWRDKDKPTDVLSFPAMENPAGLLGDIAVGHGVCVRDAADMGRPLSEHLAHMVIHAYFHLVGHDHESDNEAVIMQALEDAAMQRLGYRAPYGMELLASQGLANEPAAALSPETK